MPSYTDSTVVSVSLDPDLAVRLNQAARRNYGNSVSARTTLLRDAILMLVEASEAGRPLVKLAPARPVP
jgi:predicted transcriptional regulator